MDINKYQDIFNSTNADNLPQQLSIIRSMLEEDSNKETELNNRISELQKLNMDLFTRASTTVVDSTTTIVEETPEQELENIINLMEGK